MSWGARALQEQIPWLAILKIWSASLGNFRSADFQALNYNRLTELETPEVGPAICLKSCLGDSAAGYHLRATAVYHAS